MSLRVTVQKWLARHMAARQDWHEGRCTIRQRQLYVLPNRYGLYVGFLIFASFAMGYKVQNNFILLGVIFLFLIFMLSLVASVRNLQNLRVRARPAPYYLAGQEHYVSLSFARDAPCFNIKVEGVALSGTAWGVAEARVPLGSLMRGIYELPPMILQTQFPFGIARCWTRLCPPDTITVCPRPQILPLAQYPRLRKGAQKGKAQSLQADELGALRDYEPSDSSARIDWKRFAATRELMVRPPAAPTSGLILLEQPSGDYERGLSYLCGGVLACARAQAPALMRLNGRAYHIGSEAQRLEALQALARA